MYTHVRLLTELSLSLSLFLSFLFLFLPLPRPFPFTAKLVVTTLPRSSPGSGPVVMETERGGLVESSLNFSYVPTEVSGTSAAGSGMGKLGNMSGSFISSVTESPLLTSRKSKQNGEVIFKRTIICRTCTVI